MLKPENRAITVSAVRSSAFSFVAGYPGWDREPVAMETNGKRIKCVQHSQFGVIWHLT